MASLFFEPEVLDPANYPPGYLEEDIGDRLLAVCICFMIFQTMFVALYYASLRVKKLPLGPETYIFMPLAYLFCMANCVTGILSVKVGSTGRHEIAIIIDSVQNEPEAHWPTTLLRWGKIDVANTYIYLCSITFPKLVITWLYMRIFTTKRYRIAGYVTAGMIIATALAGFIWGFTICKPFSMLWDPTSEGGTCGDLIGGYRYISLPNVVTDVMLMVLPLPALYHLHVSRNVKLGLFVTFLVGSAGLVTSIIRTVGFFVTDLFDDRTFNSVTTMTYTTVEPSIYLIAACMPSLRPLKQHFLKDVSLSRGLLSTFGISSTVDRSFWKSSSRKSSRITRTTDIQLSSSKLDGGEGYSMNSSTHIVPKSDGFVRLEERADSRGDQNV